MKPAFAVSLVLNLALAANLLYLLEANHKLPFTGGNSSVPDSVKPKTTKSTSEIPSRKQHESHSGKIRWAQMESPNDYRAYIANLRASGCPEATVEDIVRGDTARAFALKRRELGLNATGNGPWSLQQEHALVASLLWGTTLKTDAPPPAQTTGAATEIASVKSYSSETNRLQGSSFQPAISSMRAATDNLSAGQNISSSAAFANRGSPTQNTSSTAAVSPKYPLVLQNINWDDVGLTTAQKAAVQQLQQQFIHDVGGSDQNPNNPAYLKRWQQAQPQSDLLFKAMMGVTAWENFQLLAADSANQAQNSYSSSDGTP